jgi:hypothetical protein
MTRNPDEQSRAKESAKALIPSVEQIEVMDEHPGIDRSAEFPNGVKVFLEEIRLEQIKKRRKRE